jgi:SAM-dependent methyltransferase
MDDGKELKVERNVLATAATIEDCNVAQAHSAQIAALVTERDMARRTARLAEGKLADRAQRIEQLAAERDAALARTKSALADAKALRQQINSMTLEARVRASDADNTRRELRQYIDVTNRLRPFGTCLSVLPPAELRLNVGTQTTEGNFLHQGSNSSRRVLQEFGAVPPGPMLDWGCGSGRTLNWLCADSAWRSHYHGCDVDRGAIEWLHKNGFPQVKVCDDDPPLPYEDNSFEGIFNFSVLTHIPPEKHRAWYAEFARILRPGGRALVTTLGDFALSNDNDERLGEIKKLIVEQGHAFQGAEGHYKHIAFASRAFSRKSFAGLLEEVSGADHYGPMDVFILRKS